MLINGNIVVDTESQTLTCRGKKIFLKPKEYKLLTLFLQYPHQVLTHDFIARKIWDLDQYPCDSTIRSHIRMLRESLREYGESDDIIQNVHGLGYLLNPTKDNKKQMFLRSSTMQKYLTAKTIEYLVLDQQYTIKFISGNLINYCDYPDNLQIGNYLGDAFPELIGFEEDFEKVRNKEEEVFIVKGIARSLNPQGSEYINFYIIGNERENSNSSKEKLFLVFFEDDSENLIYRQNLVQHANNICLNLELQTT